MACGSMCTPLLQREKEEEERARAKIRAKLGEQRPPCRSGLHLRRRVDEAAGSSAATLLIHPTHPHTRLFTPTPCRRGGPQRAAAATGPARGAD